MSQIAPPSTVPETSGKAIASLVISIVALGSCGLLGLIGIILGRRALNEIRASQGRLTGDGLAKADIIVGWVGVVLVLFGFLFMCLLSGFGGLIAGL